MLELFKRKVLQTRLASSSIRVGNQFRLNILIDEYSPIMPETACKQTTTPPKILTISWMFSTGKHLSVTGSQVVHHNYLFTYLRSNIWATWLVSQGHIVLTLFSVTSECLQEQLQYNASWNTTFTWLFTTALQQMSKIKVLTPSPQNSDCNICKHNITITDFRTSQNLCRILHSVLVLD